MKQGRNNDIVLIGEIIKDQLDDVITKTERYIGRKIRPLVLDSKEFSTLKKKGSFGSVMKIWEIGENK